MDTFYKYTRYFGISYLDNPTIKISTPYYLNDPFEGETGDNLITVVEQMTVENNNNMHRDAIKLALNSLVNLSGIFSVSETPRNPLMWAHYGDQHKGLCIGINKDVFEGMRDSKLNKKDNVYISEFSPVKINYDNYRFDRQTKIKNDEDLKKAVRTHLLTKSDEWIYEKEHRCILPFIFATHIKIDEKAEHVSYLKLEAKLTNVLNALKSEGKITEDNNNTYIINDGIDESDIWMLSSFYSVSFLYEIDPKYINNIYIGLRVSKQEVKSIHSKIKNSERLSHIKLFKFRLSSKRFELLPDVINDEYFQVK